MNTPAVAQKTPTDPRKIQENITEINLQMLAMHKHGIYNEEAKAMFANLMAKRDSLYQQLSMSKSHIGKAYRA